MARKAPLPDRCLVYLHDRADVGADHPAAYELLQHRIAEALGEQRGHISRAMGTLSARGFVREVKVRDRGERRRRVAYVLTEAGHTHARDLRRRWEDARIVVVDLEGRERPSRVYEVLPLLPGKGRLSDLLSATADGRLDLRGFLDRQTHVHRGRVHDVRGAIATRTFRGRADALALLDRFVEDPSARGLLVLGLPGIGKTALASRWVEDRKGRAHVLWRRAGADRTAGELLVDLARLLHAAGQRALWDLLHRPPDPAGADPRRILVRDLAKTPAVLVFDDAHAAPPEVGGLLAALLADGGSQWPKVLLLARETPAFVRAEDVASGRVLRLPLDDLAEPEADALLTALRVPEGRRRPILDRCGGHPLSLELAARGDAPPEAARRSSAAAVAEAVVSRLDARDRDALALAAVFEAPVDADIVGAPAARLLARSLLRDAGEGRVSVHDLVREAALRDLPADDLADLHARAAEHLAKGRDPGDALAALRHFVAAGAFREAEALVEARGDDLLSAGLAAPLSPLLEQLSWTARGTPNADRILLLRAHALASLARWREAAAAYEKASKARDAHVAAEALLGQGTVEHQRRSRLALPLLAAARDRLERLGALRPLAGAQYWIGCVREKAGRLDEARDAFERGRAIAFDVGDRRWEGLCAYGVGRIRSVRRDYRGAVEDETEALRLLERGGLRVDVAKVLAGLGGNLLELKRWKEAEAHLARAADEARATGANHVLSSSLYNLGSLRTQRGRLPDAAVAFQEALDLFREQEQYEDAADCAAWLGVCVSGDDPFRGQDLFGQAERLLERVQDPAAKARALRNLARASKRAGRTRDARRHLTQAIAHARAGRLSDLVAELSAERKALA